MEGGNWKSSRKRTRVLMEEERNRDGHWTRTFTSRSEPWSIIEHWASEMGYRLAATRGSSRRLYARDMESRFFRTFVDIKQAGEGRGITISAWVEAGFWARALSLFRIAREMDVDPRGLFGGVRVRRRLCRELNVLLDRFKQVPIVGSTGLHPADLDLTVHALAAAMAAVTAGLTWPAVRLIEVREGPANPLLTLVGRKLGMIGATGAALLIAQWVVTHRLKHPLYRGVAAGVAFVFFSVGAVATWTRTNAEALQTKFAYHCLHRPDESACRQLLNGLSAKERDAVLTRLRTLQKELAAGPAKPR